MEIIDENHIFLSYLGHIAYGFIFFSFLVRNILWLRVLAIVASLAFMGFNYYVPSTPLMVPIYWNTLFIATNTIQIALILWEKRNFELSGHEKFMQETYFQQLTAGELKKLLKYGYLRTSQKNQILIEQNIHVSSLLMIYEGEAQIYYNNKLITELRGGSFVGEMSFLTNNKTTARVQAKGEIQFFEWDKYSLKQIIGKDPKLMMAIQRALTSQLIAQILNPEQKSRSTNLVA